MAKAWNAGELREAIYARQVASAYYLRNPQVTLIDVGLKMKDHAYTGELAVRVHVRKKIKGPAFEVFSSAYPHLVVQPEKIPFLVDVIEGTYPMGWGWPYGTYNTRARRCDPLKGGVSVSGEWVFGYGTLGGIVENRESHEKMILSNWHVLAGSSAAVRGTRIFQPAYGDYGNRWDTVALLERHVFDQEIDAAVARLTGARGWSNEQLGVGPVTGVGAPTVGMRVTKSGRASAVTYGVIDGFEGEYPIYYQGVPHRIKHVHRIVPEDGYSEVSRAGDSGSWWLEQATCRAVGLHFAGNDYPTETALAIAMPQVLDALKVDIAGIQAPVIVPEAAVQPLAAEAAPAVLVGIEAAAQPRSARVLQRMPG